MEKWRRHISGEKSTKKEIRRIDNVERRKEKDKEEHKRLEVWRQRIQEI
jgi:hypothetical protein